MASIRAKPLAGGAESVAHAAGLGLVVRRSPLAVCRAAAKTDYPPWPVIRVRRGAPRGEPSIRRDHLLPGSDGHAFEQAGLGVGVVGGEILGFLAVRKIQDQ